MTEKIDALRKIATEISEMTPPSAPQCAYFFTNAFACVAMAVDYLTAYEKATNTQENS